MSTVAAMPDDPDPEITRLLNQMAGGDARAAEVLFPLLYPELHKLAGRFVRNERIGHTLQKTALVNEAYLRLVRPEDRTWENRAHFMAVAATRMRHLLIDYARHRNARAEGHVQSDGDEILARMGTERAKYLVALDDALSLLEKRNPTQARVVELRFFMELSNEEVAEALNVSSRTIKREWAAAKVWLKDQITAKQR